VRYRVETRSPSIEILKCACSLQILKSTQPWLTVSGLESVVQEMSSNIDDNSTHMEDALDEILDAIQSRTDAGAKASVAPIAFFASFDDSVRARCNRFWDDRKVRLANKICFVPRIGDLKLVKDGVHLNDASAKRFFEHVTEVSLAYFNPIPSKGT